jgi:hypothetical protein
MWRIALILTYRGTAPQRRPSRHAHAHPRRRRRWDYVVSDPPQHRLFFALQNRVMVVDQVTGTLPVR